MVVRGLLEFTIGLSEVRRFGRFAESKKVIQDGHSREIPYARMYFPRQKSAACVRTPRNKGTHDFGPHSHVQARRLLGGSWGLSKEVKNAHES